MYVLQNFPNFVCNYQTFKNERLEVTDHMKNKIKSLDLGNYDKYL